MKNNKHNDHKSDMNSMNSKQPPDDQIKPVADGQQEETPQVFKIVKRSLNEPGGRRKFLKAAAGAAGMALVPAVLGSICGPAKDSPCTTEPVVTPAVACGCESVCTCDHDDDQKIYTERSGGACTCDTVCRCDVVCNCDAVCNCDNHCTCDSEGGHYWHPN